MRILESKRKPLPYHTSTVVLYFQPPEPGEINSIVYKIPDFGYFVILLQWAELSKILAMLLYIIHRLKYKFTKTCKARHKLLTLPNITHTIFSFIHHASATLFSFCSLRVHVLTLNCRWFFLPWKILVHSHP